MQGADLETVSWARFAFASITVLGLMALLAWTLKYVSERGWLTPKTAGSRLSVLATLPLDARRKLVIAKCDDREYHLLLGPTSDLLLADKPHLPSPSSDSSTGSPAP
ncbi:MAG: flagellar biosynthetic protein FliO [Alphaproteobacteria bacterium]|nr:flagellar biosynthetic protein FliO [Alphaproteobacteria bacterium]